MMRILLSFVISAKKGVNTESIHQIFFKLIYMIILYAYIIETTLWKNWPARYQDINWFSKGVGVLILAHVLSLQNVYSISSIIKRPLKKKLEKE